MRIWDVAIGQPTDVFSEALSGSLKSMGHVLDGTRLELEKNRTLVGGWYSIFAEWQLSVSFSPDGKCLAFAGYDTAVRLLDLKSRKPLAEFQGHKGWISSLSFSPDGTRLASASVDRTVRLWDLTTGNNLAVLKGHTDEVTSVTFCSDGTRLASASKDGTVRLWKVTTEEILAVLKGHTQGVVGVAFRADRETLISVDYGGTVRRWKFSKIPSGYFDYFEFDGLDIKYKLLEPNFLYGNKRFHINNPD